MRITDFADMVMGNIRITRHHNQGERWTVSFENSETKDSKDDSIPCGSYGDGSSVEGAVKDYISKISGKLLVFNAMSKGDRREYMVPKLEI